MKKISSIKAFYKGLKPSYFATTASKKFMKEEFHKITTDFSFIDHGVELIEDETCYLFFQSEGQKLRFIEQAKGLTPDDQELHKLLGLTLGYSPNAVEFYVHKERLKRDNDPQGGYLQSRSISLSHCGCTFVTHVDDMTKDAKWLWDTYDYEESLHISLVDQNIGVWRTLKVPYLDFESLRLVNEQVCTILDENKVLHHT